MTKEQLTEFLTEEEMIQFCKTIIAENSEKIRILTPAAIEDRDFLAQREIEMCRDDIWWAQEALKVLEN